jgi:hypothetical protein
MATIHVARDGTNLGSFPAEEVREGLRTGRFLPTDMAWQEGMPDWRPLSQVMAEKPAAAMPASDATGTSALPVSLASSSGAAVPGGGLPWEHREQLGFLKAYFDTVGMVLLKPGEAFALMKSEGDMMGPMIFALIGGCAGIIVSVLLQLALHSIGFMADRQSALFGTGLMGLSLGYIVLSPVIVIVAAFVISGIFHVCLMMVGGAKKSFETTFRVVCFSSGSTYLLSMVPFCGTTIAGVWNLVVEIIGLARAHETDTGKAVMAVLLPIIVCCGGGLLLAFLMGAGVLSQLSHH